MQHIHVEPHVSKTRCHAFPPRLSSVYLGKTFDYIPLWRRPKCAWCASTLWAVLDAVLRQQSFSELVHDWHQQPQDHISSRRADNFFQASPPLLIRNASLTTGQALVFDVRDSIVRPQRVNTEQDASPCFSPDSYIRFQTGRAPFDPTTQPGDDSFSQNSRAVVVGELPCSRVSRTTPRSVRPAKRRVPEVNLRGTAAFEHREALNGLSAERTDRTVLIASFQGCPHSAICWRPPGRSS